MMSMGKCLALASLALCGCAGGGFTLEPISLADHEATAAKAALTSTLLDPGSARYTPLVAGKDSAGRSFVCGAVNAKNTFGGFTGKKLFALEILDGPSGRTYSRRGGDGTLDGAFGIMKCRSIVPASLANIMPMGQ